MPERDRLLVYMQCKDGLALDEVAANLNRSRSTVSRWLNRAQDEGIRARHERAGRGRKHLLDEPGRKQLVRDLNEGPEAYGFEGNLWDASGKTAHRSQVRRHIQ